MTFNEDKNGNVTISYEDYGSPSGFDYECTYKLDSGNAGKLNDYLRSIGREGTLREMIAQEFGEELKRKSFSAELDRQSIKYERFIWES